MAKKIILTGINGSYDKLHIGHLVGAFFPLVELQKSNPTSTVMGFIADLHGLTQQTPVPSYNVELMKHLLACGLNYKKAIIWNQSEVPQHCELAWIMECYTTVGELMRMTQYKDKSQKYIMPNGTNKIPTGILMYPCLMAADILLYDANVVPVGNDQGQHIELCRNIAERFNNKYGKVFTIPTGVISKESGVIYSLNDPTHKMSKSSPEGCIWCLDSKDVVEKKIKKALTDNYNKVHYDKVKQPGISNLMVIYSEYSGLYGGKKISLSQIEEKYKNIENYGVFKKDVIDLVNEKLEIFQKSYKTWDKKWSTVQKILKTNAEKCRKIASKKIEKVYKVLGLR